MRFRLIGICFLLILLSTACNLIMTPTAPILPPQVDPILLATEDLNAPPTLTPFQPDHNSPTPITTLPVPTSLHTPTKTLIPSPTHSTSTPTIAPLTVPKGLVNILILGSDMRPTDPSFRTDTILWVAINTAQKTVSVISFPRDLWVLIPGIGYQRINTSEEFGGFPLTQATFKTNFGVSPDYYAMTNFNGFANIIDLLGGIDVNAAKNLTDACDANGVGKICSVGPGMVHMDSSVALWYVRSRYTTNDIDRGRRAQEVVLAIFRRLLSLGALTHAVQIYNQFSGMVQTNLTLSDLLPMLPLLSSLGDGSSIRRFTIGYNEAYDWTTGDGARVLIPIPGAIQNIFQQAFYP